MCFLFSNNDVIRFTISKSNKKGKSVKVINLKNSIDIVIVMLSTCVCGTCSVLTNSFFFHSFSVVVQHSIHKAVVLLFEMVVLMVVLMERHFVGCIFVQFGFDLDFGCLMGRIVVDKLELDKPVLVLDNL